MKDFFVECRDIGIYEDKLYFFTDKATIPCWIRKNETKIEINVQLEKMIEKIESFDKILVLKDKILVSTLDGKYLYIFNMNSSKCTKHEIHCDGDDMGNILHIEKIGELLFLFSGTSRKVVIINTITYETKYFPFPDNVDSSYRKVIKISDGFLIFPQNGNDVLYFDNITFAIKEILVDFHIDSIADILNEDDKVIILEKCGKIIEWDRQKKGVKIYKKLESLYTEDLCASRIIPINNDYIIMPSTHTQIIKVNNDFEFLAVIDDYPPDFEYKSDREKWNKYTNYTEDNNYYYFVCRTSNYFLKINKRSGQLSWIKACLERNQQLLIKTLRSKNSIIYENENINLNDFIALLEA